MNQPDWAKVLSALYGSETTFKLPLNEDSNESGNPEYITTSRVEKRPLGKKTGLHPDNLKESVKFLYSQNMIETNPTDYFEQTEYDEWVNPQSTEISLTPQGFDVAHERELVSRQDSTNRFLVMLTFLLAGSTLIQSLTAVFTTNGDTQTFLAVVSAAILVIVLVGIVKVEKT